MTSIKEITVLEPPHTTFRHIAVVYSTEKYCITDNNKILDIYFRLNSYAVVNTQQVGVTKGVACSQL